MTGVRPPVAAGHFYPADPDELAGTVDRLLHAAPPVRPHGRVRALVAPHAGYVYSGAVAAAAFAALPAPVEDLRVVLTGPSHFAPLRGVAVSGADAWETPLGAVALDRELRTAAVAAGAVVDDLPHRGDHALEVELPFLQRRAGRGLRVLPAAIGASSTDAAAFLEAVVAAGGLVVVSTDLSHYHDGETARRLDRRTAEAVVALDAEAIGERHACGADALRSLVAYAARAGWSCSLLALGTSADASGDRRRVVGYGAFAVFGS
jgi:AmmeMemoRadiSam system protein B